MGLPLFVAPVESDLPSKAASKVTTTSPGRSGIRRSIRSDSRESRNQARNASVRIYGAVQPRLPRSNQDGLLPWVESPGPLDPSLPEPRSRPGFQEARESWLSSNNPATILRNRQNFQQQVESIFGGDWRERGPPPATSQRETESRDADERLWSAEARSSSRARRAQVVPPLPSRFDRSSPDRPRPYRGSPPHGHRGLRTGGLSPLGSAPATASRASGPRYNARPLRSARDRRIPTARHSLGLDGLGDRDRSLSPEVWDTLLSTLTPDPQQPSAGSSFASTELSQSAGPSSGTPLSLPDIVGQPADAQCDSGCEHSDVNMEEDEENVDLTGGRRRRPLSSDGRQRVSPYDPDGPIGGPASHHAARPRPEARRSALRIPANQSNSLSDVHRRGALVENTVGVPRGMPLAGLLNRAEGWGAQVSGEEASGEESGADGLQQRNRGESTGPAHNATLGGEEEWSGMQRIVSSLARREDIPEEWWAEVGLSRTLPRDDATNQ